MAAATVAQIAGVSHDAIVRAVESFTGLEHALEPVAVVRGVRFVNDSKATNIEAAKQAIEAFDRGLVVIMGGRFKSGDFTLLREPLRSRGATVVAIGEATPLIREALDGVVPVHSGSDAVGGGSARVRSRARRWHGRAGARVRKLRHVPRLCGTGTDVQKGSDGVGGGEHDARAVNSRQSASAVGSWLLGTQAAPVCEAGVPIPRLTDDC